MKPSCKMFILIFSIIPLHLFAGQNSKATALKDISTAIFKDYRRFYASRNLKYILGGVCIAGVVANTNADRETQNWFQGSIRNNDTDQYSKVVKPIGNIYEPLGIYAGLTLLGGLTKQTSFGAAAFEWGTKSLRTIIVGSPMVGTLQYVLGASRPREDGSEWRPFSDTNAVSGHAFMGAVPFLTTSKMVKSKYLKLTFYAGSLATGLSRINDNRHYLSQVALGWWLAYLSINSVDLGNNQRIDVEPGYSWDGCKIRLYLSL